MIINYTITTNILLFTYTHIQFTKHCYDIINKGNTSKLQYIFTGKLEQSYITPYPPHSSKFMHCRSRTRYAQLIIIPILLYTLPFFLLRESKDRGYVDG